MTTRTKIKRGKEPITALEKPKKTVISKLEKYDEHSSQRKAPLGELLWGKVCKTIALR